jgi:hypothetical protein
MTIESKIDKLITAIEALTAAMTTSQKTTPVHEPVHEPVPAPTEAVTAEDLQTLCTHIVRKDRTKKAGIVAVLAEYNAKLISDIATHHYMVIKTKLEALL